MNRREVHYHLRRLPTCVVVVASVPGALEIQLVPHLVHHSPTGMEFGYAGNGSADLALSLLTFHLEADPTIVKRLLTGERHGYSRHAKQLTKPIDLPAVRVVALYQRFKDHALGGHGDDAIDLTGWAISRWIKIEEAKLAQEETK